jgi:hypothetical protein
MQADLLTRLSQQGSALAEGIARIQLSIRDGFPDPDGPRKSDHEVLAAMKEIQRVLPRVLQTAEAYHVSEDMCRLVQHAGGGLEDLDRWDRTLAPTPTGIARFDRPLPIRDVRGLLEQIHWAVWWPQADEDGVPVTCVAYFNDLDDPDDVAQEFLAQAPQVRDSLGRWGFIRVDPYSDDMRLGPPTNAVVDEEQLAKYIEAGVPNPQSDNPVRFMHAFFLMLNQTITHTSAPDLPRHAMKRAARMSIKPRVTVVKLRRSEYPEREDGEHGTVNWTCRWIVRGFWRWQTYGPGRTLRKRIWINPYVKGPQGAPLKTHNIVYGLHR